jgi:hypothetical protein
MARVHASECLEGSTRETVVSPTCALLQGTGCATGCERAALAMWGVYAGKQDMAS